MRGLVVIVLIAALTIAQPLLGRFTTPAMAQTEPQPELIAPVAPVDSRIMVVGLGMIFGVFAYNYTLNAASPFAPAIARVIGNLRGVATAAVRGAVAAGTSLVALVAPTAVDSAAVAATVAEAAPVVAAPAAAAPVAGTAARAATRPAIAAYRLIPVSKYYRSAFFGAASAVAGAIVGGSLYRLGEAVSGSGSD